MDRLSGRSHHLNLRQTLPEGVPVGSEITRYAWEDSHVHYARSDL